MSFEDSTEHSIWREREWLETNGIGGFASGTLSGAVSRRYHAFLCAATRAPQQRAVLVSKIDETVRVGEQIFALGVNFWRGSIAPRGDQFLTDFQLDPLPRWIYEIPLENELLRLEKVVWMPHQTNSTVAQYRILSGPNCQISIRPFVTGRDYHATHCANLEFKTGAQVTKNQVTMQPYPHLPALHFAHSGDFEAAGEWYYDFEWPLEAERGLDCHEDAWMPGAFRLELSGESNGATDAFFAASTALIELDLLPATKNEEIARRARIGGNSNWHEVENRLKRAADQPIVRREDGQFTVLAGYHWFTDWGRDTMIALPGLCLTTGRFEVAAGILKGFAGTMSQGMIPNRFPESGQIPDFNTVDATLWFFHAVAQFGEISGDWKTVRGLYPSLCQSLEWHLAGTRYGIGADPEDGLLRAGDANSQLTWMDAKIGDVAFTPRSGKAVEIQALWHNALCELANLARRFDDAVTAGICVEWTRKVEANFADKFWNESEGCLFDCIASNGDFRDGAIRPNQIFAVSLPHHLLSREQEKSVVEVVERELLTPHGLRSLSARDSRYRGAYVGNVWNRDSAYHQGTVWAWPLGGFLGAYLKVHDHSQAAKNQVRVWMEPLISHLDEAGFGSISEIFDGDAPHTPRGCIAQAWSVAEILRLWEESK